MKVLSQGGSAGWWLVVGMMLVGMVARSDGAGEEALTALTGYDGGFFVRSAEEAFELRLNGRVQLRYQYEQHDGEEDLSSFYVRRLRLDFTGFVLDPAWTFRIMPDFARDASLRDGWVNYAHTPALQLRAGQFYVPFQWQRSVAGSRQHFVERGLPSRDFGFPDGYDIGVMLHGRATDRRWAYGLGVFDGAGRNVKESHSNGNMASARVARALTGGLPREESDYALSETPQWAVGFGVQAANQNEVRAWDLGRSDPDAPDRRADWAAVTADTRLAYRGFSLAVEGYWRGVEPRAAEVDDYDGWAYMVTAGWFVLPERCEITGRYSQQRDDRDDAETERTEWGAGVNIYFAGHHRKLRLQHLNQTHGTDGHDRFFIIEQHLQF